MVKKELKISIEDFLPYQIDYTANYNKSFRREFQTKYIAEDVTPDEFGILCLIHEDTSISQSELAKFLFKGKAHVGKILNEMEVKGLIKRSVDIKNNVMIKHNQITEEGKAFIDKAYDRLKIIKIKMNKEFSKSEVKEFISYLKRFRSVLGSLVDVKLK